MAAWITEFLFYHIVVAIEEIEAVLLCKFGKEPKYIAVHFNNLFDPSIFPKFVSVPELNIGKSILIVVLESGEVEVLIF